MQPQQGHPNVTGSRPLPDHSPLRISWTKTEIQDGASMFSRTPAGGRTSGSRAKPTPAADSLGFQVTSPMTPEPSYFSRPTGFGESHKMSKNRKQGHTTGRSPGIPAAAGLRGGRRRLPCLSVRCTSRRSAHNRLGGAGLGGWARRAALALPWLRVGPWRTAHCHCPAAAAAAAAAADCRPAPPHHPPPPPQLP